MSKIRLTDRQSAFIRPYLLPPARTGRPRTDNRRTIEGILYFLNTGCYQPATFALGALSHSINGPFEPRQGVEVVGGIQE
jgi:hypothetical protein